MKSGGSPKKHRPVRPDEAYSTALLCEITGITSAAIANALNNGLAFTRVGNRSLILGSEFLRWMGSRTQRKAGGDVAN